jgi:SnoaL-like domain
MIRHSWNDPPFSYQCASVGIVMSFNEYINRRDLDELSRLMTDDHVFIDSANSTVSGKEACLKAWKGFFAAFPDYRNHLELVALSNRKAVMVGCSVRSDVRLAGPALWTAKIEGQLIAEWHVYEDTSANRALLGLEDSLPRARSAAMRIVCSYGLR